MLFRFIDLILYGHFWIALAAWMMQAQSQLLYFGEYRWTALDGFITAGTLVIYAIHRLVAMRLQQAPVYAGRFKVMNAYQSHIVAYAVMAAVIGGWFFFQLSFRMQLLLLVPCLVALGYVLPVFRGRRLRDFPYLKIFLIAFSWAWLTVVGPVLQWEQTWNSAVFWMFIERAAFIFAITIPFDIRDLELDQEKEVATLPGRLGIQRAKKVAYAALGLMLFAATWNTIYGHYSLGVALGLLLSAVLSGLLIYGANAKRHDYYYTGLLDGTMILQAVLVGLAICFFSFG